MKKGDVVRFVEKWRASNETPDHHYKIVEVGGDRFVVQPIGKHWSATTIVPTEVVFADMIERV